MDESPYSKREQDEYRRDVLATLARIEQQVIKTNGRVTHLETWQQYMIGYGAAMGTLLVPVFIYFVTKVFFP